MIDMKKLFDDFEAGADGMEFFILDEDKKPVQVPMFEWARFYGAHRQLLLDEGDGWSVSSIFLGFDHSPLRTVPLIFETMVDHRPDGDYDIFRYATYEECAKAHSSMVEQCKADRASKRT